QRRRPSPNVGALLPNPYLQPQGRNTRSIGWTAWVETEPGVGLRLKRRCRWLKVHAADVGGSRKPRNILPHGLAPATLFKKNGNLALHRFEGQLPSVYAALKTQHVVAIAAADWNRAKLPRLQLQQECLDLRYGAPARDLPQIAALLA